MVYIAPHGPRKQTILHGQAEETSTQDRGVRKRTRVLTKAGRGDRLGDGEQGARGRQETQDRIEERERHLHHEVGIQKRRFQEWRRARGAIWFLRASVGRCREKDEWAHPDLNRSLYLPKVQVYQTNPWARVVGMGRVGRWLRALRFLFLFPAWGRAWPRQYTGPIPSKCPTTAPTM